MIFKRNSSLIYIIFLLSLSFLFIKCATIMHGSKQEISFSSSPTDATVRIDGAPRGKTPVIVNLKRGMSHSVKIKLKDYEPYEMNITKSVSGWVAGNIIFGGIIGLIVDAGTGGLYKLTPQQIYAELEKSQKLAKDNCLYIAVTLQPESNWQKIGELSSKETSK